MRYETERGGRPRNVGFALGLLAVVFLIVTPAFATDGHFMHGVGPINQAMGGAGTGACMDVSGSLGWNPACTVRFDGIRLEANAEYFIPWRSLGSTVSPSAFGPGFPQHEMSGETVSARNPSMMPSFTFVKHNPDSKNAWHFGMLGVAGFGVDYAENTDFSNPILTAQPPNGMGFGAIDSNYALMKTPIGMSRLVTNRLSVGFSAVPALSMLRVTPAPFSAPVMNGSGYPEYMSAEKSSKALGIGASAGVNYRARRNLTLGTSYSSAIKFGKFQWQYPDYNGASHGLEFRMDMPAVTSVVQQK